ncbi:MAG: AMP-binding protein [Gammaproteobacteria bacterium]|nr:AMP-binding protein [Gammaproteobacteria bacterium]
MNHNLYQRIAATFENAAEKTCIRTSRGDWTYERLRKRVEGTAGALCRAGVGAGDRVLVQAGKCPESLALYLSCLQIGAVYVPLNTAYTERELQYFVEDTEPSLIVLESRLNSSGKIPCSVWTIDDSGHGTLNDHVANATSIRGVAQVAEDDIAAILYTSGTTGRSKGAMLTHGNLESNADVLIDYWGWESTDVLLHVLPIYHVHGLFVAIHCVLLTGTEMIWHERFDSDRVVADLSDSTVLMGVPTHYTRLLNHSTFERKCVRNMRVFISGSAPLSAKTFHEFEKRTGLRILERYGMSETLMNTSNPLNGERVAGTVGFPLPDVQLRVTNSSGQPQTYGEIGQIELKGPNVFNGYWRMPDRTALDFTSDGYFKTGDVGFQDAKGRVSIVGRDKDVIISGGLNVYPVEVEDAIEQMEVVLEAAVIGAPHADFGEGVVAVVVANQPISLATIDSFLDSRLARFKHPKALCQVESLPKNAMGKIQKNVLRERLTGIFSNSQSAHQ